jgi:hypothetical protein
MIEQFEETLIRSFKISFIYLKLNNIQLNPFVKVKPSYLTAASKKIGNLSEHYCPVDRKLIFRVVVKICMKKNVKQLYCRQLIAQRNFNIQNNTQY